ncbi:hypothetical protein EA796_00775 [Pseudomonas sp. AOB-7]|uniref:hypothetical protein n=1 Tax=Pseudomonas sp. AOB-7 TaxID=2482750 RepID=UPI000EFD2774|nr:hypothetical protein [Pseudomonas sp. AOB-7]RMH86396.1 hypothetical protein EA796_00775 [Pseudomonas sp. AOB-7]
MSNKVTFTLEEQGGEVCLTLDLRESTRNTKAGRLANDLYSVAMQQVLLDRVPACYRHPPSNTLH